MPSSSASTLATRPARVAASEKLRFAVRTTAPASVVPAAQKPVVLGLGVVNFLQNFIFFFWFTFLWWFTVQTPLCTRLYNALALQSVTCAAVSVLIVLLCLAAAGESKRVFAVAFFLHFLGGVSYTLAVVLTGLARYDNRGEQCVATLAPGHGDRITIVWGAQLTVYLFYTAIVAYIGYLGFF